MMPDAEKPLVLITGATGFIGSHVLHQLLQAEYPVRATARPAKVDVLKETYGNKVDVVPIADLVTGDYTKALKGVGAIIHVASPMIGKEEAALMVHNAVEGTMNITRQAAAAGVKRLIITSSLSSLADMNKPELFYTNAVLTDKDFNPATVEETLSGKHDPFWVYCAVKALSERAVWKFADEHPEIDISTIHPSFIYGPLLPGTKIAKGDYASLSTIDYFWKAVLPEGGSSVTIDRVPQLVIPITVDVRDAARAHVLALTAPLASVIGQKRFLVTGPSLTWLDAVIHLREVMPELADRLPTLAEGANEKPPLLVITGDVARTEEVLGLGEYIDWRKTAEDTIKSILEVEKSWEA